MSDKEWDQIMDVHLKGSYSCTKAAWPIFQQQGFGRVVNTASAAGLYGVCSALHMLSSTSVNHVMYRQLWSGKLQCGQDGSGGVHEGTCC